MLKSEFSANLALRPVTRTAWNEPGRVWPVINQRNEQLRLAYAARRTPIEEVEYEPDTFTDMVNIGPPWAWLAGVAVVSVFLFFFT